MARPTRPLLSLERITDAALAEVAASGDLQMVQVAKRLGVAASSLYHHVAGKAELVDAVRRRMLETMPPVPPGMHWRDAVDHLLRQLTATYARHPRVLPLFFDTTVADERAIAVYEPVFASLLEGGFEPAQLRLVVALVDFQAMGLAHGFPAPAMTDSIRVNLPAYTASVDHSRYDLTAATDFSAEALVRGLEAILAATLDGDPEPL